jgi:threonine/homoserine/homoserine lactone efflux protein
MRGILGIPMTKRIINILAGVILLIVGFEYVQGSSMAYWGIFINSNKLLGYFLGTILIIGACYFIWQGLKAIDKNTIT